jgi:hypothetical protein
MEIKDYDKKLAALNIAAAAIMLAADQDLAVDIFRDGSRALQGGDGTLATSMVVIGHYVAALMAQSEGDGGFNAATALTIGKMIHESRAERLRNAATPDSKSN